jgi:hypothetical protein
MLMREIAIDLKGLLLGKSQANLSSIYYWNALFNVRKMPMVSGNMLFLF